MLNFLNSSNQVPYAWCLLFGIATTFCIWLWERRGKGHNATRKSGLMIILTDIGYEHFFTRKIISLIYAILLSWFYANVYFIFVSGEDLLEALMVLLFSLLSLLVARLSSEGFIALIKVAENTTHIKYHIREYMYETDDSYGYSEEAKAKREIPGKSKNEEKKGG